MQASASQPLRGRNEPLEDVEDEEDGLDVVGGIDDNEDEDSSCNNHNRLGLSSAASDEGKAKNQGCHCVVRLND